jgi:hypothetical protein
MIPMFLLLLFILCDKYLLNNHQDNSKQTQIFRQKIKELQKSKQDKKQISYIFYLKYIEQVATDLKIKITNIKINKKVFDIQAIGTYKNTMNFMTTIEQRMKIKSLVLTKNKSNKILTQCRISMQQWNDKYQIKYINNLANPFKKKRQFKPKLFAIIGKHICINNKWYEKGQMIKKYKIKIIDRNSIILTNPKKTIKLKLWKVVK